MSYTSHVEVAMSVLVTIETDSHPGDIPEVSFKGLITDVLADQLRQYNDHDLTATITWTRVVDTVLDENTPTEKEKEDYPIEDWRYEVMNGDTKVGYEQWVINHRG
ncbi:MAG: hypothetical protein LUQ37_08665 [Methanoregulaceae archaeon]|jgi:hypothetical protein|nr:hypothetical protein [Methanoregulaceae archaeon]